MAHTFYYYPAGGGIVRKKAPACPYRARAEFVQRVKAASKRGEAVELINDNGGTLEEYAPASLWNIFQACGTAAACEGSPRLQEKFGYHKEWRKSYRV